VISNWVLVPLTALGVTLAAASYTDLKAYRIPNLWSLGLLSIGLVVGLWLVWVKQLAFDILLRDLVLSFGISYIFYYLGLWSAGDAKLFWGSYLTLSTAFGGGMDIHALLVNIFVPVFAVLIILILMRTSWQEKWKAMLKLTHPTFWTKAVIQVAGFVGAAVLLQELIPHIRNLSYFLLIPVVLFLMRRPFFKTRRRLVLGGLLLLTAFAMAWAPTLFISSLVLLLPTFLIFRIFILDLGESIGCQEIAIVDLQPKMIPAGYIVRQQDQYVWVKSQFTSLFGLLLSTPPEGEVLLGVEPNGLSAPVVAKVQELCRQGCFTHFGNKILIQRKLPYAPFIALGVLLTFLSHGKTFVRFLVEIIGKGLI